jgi:hypothetical protein
MAVRLDSEGLKYRDLLEDFLLYKTKSQGRMKGENEGKLSVPSSWT